MVTLTINGQEVQAEEGQTVLEVARTVGIEIPTLCYYPFLEPFGSCRLCVVEVVAGGRPGLQTACTFPVGDGLEVKTDTPIVIEARKAILGMLLSRTPKVPEIQELAAQYGITEPPFDVVDADEKCILCGLCVRTCHELVKAGAINFANRGVDRQVAPPFMEKTRVCIGCGACTIVCPTGAIDMLLQREGVILSPEVEVYEKKPLGPTAAIHVPSLQAVPRVPVIDTDACIRFRQNDRSEGEIPDACGVCQMACEAGAVDFTHQDEVLELDIGTVIVATGFQMWDATLLPQYSYGKSPHIITGLEFERLSNAGGPTAGQILLSDGRKPERVAIIHCVGSRDENAHEYCSRICCMYSLKQAHLVREKTGAEVYEFYMDMRAFGKGYEEFYERIQEEGVIMVRGRGAEVEILGDGKLRVKGEDADLGRLVSADVDMVVLNTAVEATHDADRTAALFGLGRSPDGFFAESHPKLRPVETNTEGVFLAGACQGPRDVPDTVAHAGAAASLALALMDQGEVTVSPQVAYIPEELCSGCRVCNELCPYTAILFDEEKQVSVVNEALCKGCGTCVAACPSGIIVGKHFTDEQILVQIEALLRTPVQ
jgi:heterodisulfide reductase subunit A